MFNMFGKEMWVAQVKGKKTDEYGSENFVFEKPKKYLINYQPMSGYMDYQHYGNRSLSMYKAIVPMEMLGKIKPNDKAYLIDGDCLDINKLAQNDDESCSNANYRVVAVLPQNKVIRVDLEKINS